MKLPKWLHKKLDKTNYPKQIIDIKIKDIIDRLDSYLSEHSATMPSDSIMVIKSYKIGLFSQVLLTETISTQMISMLPKGFIYIPRSIAFVVEADGTWCFYIAYRSTGEMDIDKAEMFIHLLNRTNDARI